MTPPYDPVPAAVREAWLAFRDAVKEAGLHMSTTILHTHQVLQEGEDHVLQDDEGRVVEVNRYWPGLTWSAARKLDDDLVVVGRAPQAPGSDS